MRNYKDLRAWQRAHELTLRIYRVTQAFPSEEKYGLTSQMRRASASLAANLAEGCGRRADREMARFVQIAMGSGMELSYHLLLAKDLGILGPREFLDLEQRLQEVMRMLSSLQSKLRAPLAS